MKARVFLVDDHSLVRGGFKRLLQSSSLLTVVGEADSLESALPQLEKSPADLITMDLMLPGLSGRDAVEKLLECQSKAKVLVVSARVESREVEQLMKLGILGYVSKAASAEEFLLAAETVARGQVYLSGAAASTLAEALRKDQQSEVTLSRRQREVLNLIAAGQITREIAESLFLSPKTVEKYRSQILRKLDCRNQIEALEKARGLGLLEG